MMTCTPSAWPTAIVNYSYTGSNTSCSTLVDSTCSASTWNELTRTVKYKFANNTTWVLPKFWNANAIATNYNWTTCGDYEIEVQYANSCWTQWSNPLSLEDRIRDIITQRHAPAVVRNEYRKALPHTTDIRELRARETLRRVIGDDKFQRLVRDGFVSVRGKDNLHYQIFPGHGITCVFDKGKMIERLCVILKGDFPPTDSIIMRYLMLLNNPAQFRSFAIKHSVFERQPTILKFDEPTLTLAEIYREMKRQAA